MCDTTVKFSVLCSLFDGVTSTKKGPLKRKHIRTFLDRVYTDHEYFSALRLMLPSEDKQRSTFGLKEATLGKFLAEALCLSSEAVDAQKLVNWRKGGTRVGSNAGNFASIATEVLSSRQRVISTGLKIKDVNDLLDRLAAAGSKEKVPILQEIINKTNSQEMKWIVMIILKDLKLGISRKTIFSELHPDAEDLFNVTCDLKLVCEKLRNRNERYSRKDIEVGKAVRPQLASRIDNVEDAWMKLQGKKVTVECKFDGFRIQIHKDGTKFYFYSRNFNDLYEKCKHGIVDVLIQNVLPEKCILDGELVAWDRSKKSFVEFDKILEVATAVRDGLETSQQLCYIAFDLLYYGSSSVIHLPLRERQELLCKVIRPVKRRLEVLNPYCGLGTQRSVGDSEWSIVAKSVEEVKHFFQRCVENRDEGIVVKDLDSKWQPGDRTGKWLKLKPDYVLGSDLDVLIIGGYFGSGRWGGHVAQFLLGIAEKPKAEEYPTMFSTFCKVGTGYNDEEREHLVQKLNPYFIRNEKNSKPPRCYNVTNHAKERPDVWVYPPDKSVILEVNSDIRTISTEVFAAPHGLRFPRVNKVRYEKPWYDCLDIQTLINMVRSEKGSAADLKGHRKLERKVPEHRKLKKARSSCLPLVPSHMSNTDVSHVEHTTKIFEKSVFYFVNYSAEQSKESLHKLVTKNEGSVSMNLSNAVTHTIASEKKGIKFQAAAAHGDVIHFSWIIDCCTTKTLLPVSPKYFLHLSDQTKEKRKDDIDDYGDRYSLDIDVADLKQIFKNIDTAALSIDPDKLARAKKKYCSSSALCQFSDCHFYFHRPIHSSNPDCQMVAETALKRQELEVSMHAGDVSKTLNANVTHMIVYTSSKQALPFRTIVKSMSSEEVKFLVSDKLKIWSHRWIDEHMLGTCGHPMKDNYDLRDPSFQFNEDIVNQVKMGMRGKIWSTTQISPIPSSQSAELQLSRKVDRGRYVNDLLNRLDLGYCADTIVRDNKVRDTNGGEKKRLSISCELIASPSVIFADEPTTGFI